jgi:hypothetical protein
MIKKFANIDPFSRFILKGTIKAGCKAVKTACPNCQRMAVGLKLTDKFYCSKCGRQITPKSGEGEFTQSLPYFLVPDDIKEVVGTKPERLTIVPAYASLERTIPNSYARYTRDGRILCTGDGAIAKRYDPATRQRVEQQTCGEDCLYYKSRECKPSATFYFYLPDVDILSGYRLMTKSAATIANIIITLKKIANTHGVLSRVPCELRIIEKRRQSDNKLYRILELIPPRFNLQRALDGGPVDVLRIAGQKGQ